MDESAQTYQPGTCNIGPAERRYRRTAAKGLAVLTLIVGVPPLVIGSPWWAGMLVLPFAFLTALNVLQDRSGFCVHYARLGKHAMGDLGDTADVADVELQAADIARARQLLLRSAAVAAAITALEVALLATL